MQRSSAVLPVIISLLLTASASGVVPTDRLLPRSTKGYLAIPDVVRLLEHFDRTAAGQLMADPAMQPFLDDLERQLEERFKSTGFRVGVTPEDLRDICAGEVAVAVIQPEDVAQKHAVAAIADVTGKEKEVQALLAKIKKTMSARKATRKEDTIGKVPVVVYEVPIQPGAKKTFQVIIAVHEGHFISTDHREVATQIIRNLTGSGEGNCLAEVEAYQATMERCTRESELEPDIRWFVEPFGYAEIAREIAPPRKRRRTDIVRALRIQGFDAILGAGGLVNLATEEYDLVHRAFVYAPRPADGTAPRFELAARILGFPLTSDLKAESWVPANVSSYATGTWDLQKSYAYIDTLVDEMTGEAGFFSDLTDSLKNDPNGPQLDLEKEIVAYLGNRAAMITHCKVPVVASSEHFLIAIELTDAIKMAASLEKALANDPAARRIEVDDHVIWEIISEEEETPVVQIEGTGDFTMLANVDQDLGGFDDETSPLLANAAISVVKGHLMIGSHAEYVVEMIRHTPDMGTLADEFDYKNIREELGALGASEDCAQLFSRLDDEIRGSYELLRQGLMPESEGLVGRILNQLLAPEDKHMVREQRIDGSKMPDFQVVRRYLGTLGTYLRTEDNGWYLAGMAVPKETPFNEAAQEESQAISEDADKSTLDQPSP